MESDLSNARISSSMRSLLGDDDDDDFAIPSRVARPWSYASSNPRASLTSPTASPAARRAMARFQEADIGDTPRLYSLRKQPSSHSFLNGGPASKKSSSEPNLLEEQVDRRPSPPHSIQGEGTTDVDITENGAADAMLKLEPAELAQFRKWVIGFCVVNFDLEIGQGEKRSWLYFVRAPVRNTCGKSLLTQKRR